jgi:hypothetical protein
MNSIWNVSAGRVQLYYVLVFIVFIYSVYKFRNSGFFVLVVFAFFLGLYVYLGKSVQDAYRIMTVLFGIYIAQKSKALSLITRFPMVSLSFLIFSYIFLQLSFTHHDSFNLMFSQYSRYFLLFLFFFILQKNFIKPGFINEINKLIYYLISLQIIFSILKYLITGPMESIVGSLAFSGGSYGVTFPLLAFVFLWFYKEGHFIRKDWYFIIGLVFIGFVNYKRAIWFMMPIIISLMMFYIPRKKIPLTLLILSVVLIPTIFYVGVRLNPTLNKEQKVWGSFDLTYALDYSKEYSFGNEEQYYIDNTGVGRGGASINLFKDLFSGDLSKEDWIGYGLTLMYVDAPADDMYLKELLNINSIGSATGFIQSYVVFGFIGVLVTLFFTITLLIQARNLRIRVVMISLFLWEYFFYTGSILREPALSFLLIYIIVYSNQFWNKTKANLQDNNVLLDNRASIIKYSNG